MTGLLVTGGAGFIGSSFVRQALADGFTVLNLDALSYAGNSENVRELCDEPRHKLVVGQIQDRSLVESLLTEHQPRAIVNFAAETHVDRSIDDPTPFLETNVAGTHELLKAALCYWRSLPATARDRFRFLQISTDEVYGSKPEGSCDESSPYAPSSPYAASKAAADHFVAAYHQTYGLPTLITHSCNNYGPRQHPEKLIPHITLSALAGRKLPIYGDGLQVREWLHVEDNCSAIWRVLADGRPGRAYNIGGERERTNAMVVHSVCDILDRIRPRKYPHETLIERVADRPGHDRRYSLDCTRIETELGWRPAISFEEGLVSAVSWYVNHADWCERIVQSGYRLERLGLPAGAQP